MNTPLKKSKILIHHHSVAYQTGNNLFVQSFIAVWAKSLSLYFKEVGLLLNVSDSKMDKQDTLLKKENIKLHILGNIRKGRKISKTNELKNICQKVGVEYDFLLIRGMTPQQMLVFKYAFTPKKYFLLVGSIKASKPKWEWNWLAAFIRFRYHQRLYQLKKMAKTAQVFANAPHVVEELKEYFSIKAKFLPTNTISKNHFLPYQERIIKPIPEILFCGRVVVDKGIEDLIKAIGILKLKHQLVKVKVVGDVSKPYLKILEKLAEKYKVQQQISFEGFIPFGESLMKFYKESDIYILPSWHEGFPHSIWESAASCTPIITTKVGGIPSLVSKKDVFFVDVKNPKSIANTIMKCIENDKQRYQKIKSIYHKAQDFSVEKCAEHLARHLY